MLVRSAVLESGFRCALIQVELSDGIRVEAASLSWCFWSDAVQPLSREQSSEQLVGGVGGFMEDAGGGVLASGGVDVPFGW